MPVGVDSMSAAAYKKDTPKKNFRDYTGQEDGLPSWVVVAPPVLELELELETSASRPQKKRTNFPPLWGG